MKNYNDKLTRNIKFGESWSTRVINGIEYKRQVPPTIEYLHDVTITAEEGQIIRDRLNEVYGSNPLIGYRDKNNEIMLLIDSFWREIIFQLYLYKKGLSTTKDGDHPKGKAIDLVTPKGMTPYQFYRFIRYKCNTKFNWFKVYRWGIHCSRR